MDLKQLVSKPVIRVVVLQLIFAFVFSALVALLAGSPHGWPAAYGGAVAVVASLIYALRASNSSDDADIVLKAHMRAQMAKIFMTAVLFFVAVQLFPSAEWLWLMTGFAVTTLAYWFALLIV